jgi:predicted O-methyltransferase YrrM
MFQRVVSFLTLFSIVPFLTISADTPSIIDYGTYPEIKQTYHQPIIPEAWRAGYYAFNYAPELALFFADLQKTHKIDTVVETGTFNGSTTVAFSHLFNHVHTIEVQEDKYINAVKKFKSYSNVRCHLGSSEKVLKHLLPTISNKRSLFYLDAHWESFWPLLDELEEISKTHKDNCIIVIDDFKVPNRPDILYDYYKHHECSFEYVKSHLDKVYSSYTSFYLIPKSVDSRAKLVVIPKQWQKNKHKKTN